MKLMNITNLHCIILAVLLLVGCARPTENASRTSETDDASETAIAYDAKWSERNADIYRFLLAELDDPPRDRIYFITTTPMAEWGEAGNWETIPPEELKKFPIAAKYRPAHEAYLQDGRVLEKGTDAEAWMQWISVRRWISNTQVEVEDGVWCCPLGGGASRTIYEKVNGQWRVKEYGDSWVS